MPKISQKQLDQLRRMYPELSGCDDKIILQYAITKLSELDKKTKRKHPELPNFL